MQHLYQRLSDEITRPSTPVPSTTATTHSRESSSSSTRSNRSRMIAPPASDLRYQFPSFSFIIATDSGFVRSNVQKSIKGGSGVQYLHHKNRYLTPWKSSSLFYTVFQWTGDDGRGRWISRVRLCSAWQKALNRTLRYVGMWRAAKDAGFAEAELAVIEGQRAMWNGYLHELDINLTLLYRLESTHQIPTFTPTPYINLTNPSNRTPRSHLDGATTHPILTSTFLDLISSVERKYDGALSGEMQRFVGRLGMELGDDYEEIVATDWDFGVVREKGRGLPPVRALSDDVWSKNYSIKWIIRAM